MNLTDIKSLQDISKEFGIPVTTLQTRLKLKSLNLVEGEDYRRMGIGQSVIFSPEGVKKITKQQEAQE